MSGLQNFLQYQLFSISGTPIDVSTLALAVIVALASIVLSRIGEKATISFLEKRGVLDRGSIGATGRLVHYCLLGVGFAVAIQTLGINLTALFTAGAVFAIALGFAMQNIAQNFVAGLILLIERTIKPGDILEIEGRVVKVTSLGMRATVTRTWDSEDYIIPNALLVSATVKNFTLRDRLYRIRSIVGVAYESDMARVEAVLMEVAESISWRDQGAKPVILMKQFGSSSVDWDVSVWVQDPFARSLSQSDLNKAVWFALKDAGITIAFPQMDVHFDKDEVDGALGGRPGE